MITLKAEKRNPNVKAKKLRREGYVTGILSGKEMKEPVALQFDGAEAAKFIKANKEGTQVYLDIEGKKVDALVKNIDYNPIEKQLMALDFQALVAGEKVSTTVAVKLEHTDMVSLSRKWKRSTTKQIRPTFLTPSSSTSTAILQTSVTFM